MPPSFCSRQARAHTINPAGTATEAAHWLLIEDPTPWGEHAVEEADWYPHLQAPLQHWRTALPDLRVQLIRRRLTQWEDEEHIRCFIARTGPDAALHTQTLASYAALTQLDVPDRMDTPSTSDALLVLTCTNGRRDACCAKWGRPVAQAAAECHPKGAWQTSHLGGHRFASTVLVLPVGAHYAWIDPQEVPDLVRAHQSEHLFDLSHYRGPVHSPRPVQAACIALRIRLDVHTVQDVHGQILTEMPNAWTVAVHLRNKVHTARVTSTHGATLLHSCQDDAPKPHTEWTVEWIE